MKVNELKPISDAEYYNRHDILMHVADVHRYKPTIIGTKWLTKEYPMMLLSREEFNKKVKEFSPVGVIEIVEHDPEEFFSIQTSILPMFSFFDAYFNLDKTITILDEEAAFSAALNFMSKYDDSNDSKLETGWEKLLRRIGNTPVTCYMYKAHPELLYIIFMKTPRGGK